MRRWLFDTNVISETRRPKPSAVAFAWIESLTRDQICTASVVLAELRYGALICRNEMLQSEIQSWIDLAVRPWFKGRIYEADEQALLSWRILARQRQRARESAPPVDLLLAAIARNNELGVATRDVKPFIGTGVPVLNPWTGESFNGA